MLVKRYTVLCTITCSILFLSTVWTTVERTRDNGDIYTVDEETFIREHMGLMQQEYDTTTEAEMIDLNESAMDSNIFDYGEIVDMCNSSFSIPMDYYIAFNTTAELPDLVDKTGMCFIRCFYEKARLIENWKLNLARIQTNIWPATGDSIDACEREGAEEPNACVRAYAIGKCLTIRALAEARNKSTV